MWCRSYNSTMKVREGFTLVELSLSIAFIAVLSIAVTLIVTNSIAAYHRGLVLNQVNTVGMELVNDMRAAVQSAPAISVEGMCSTMFTGSDEVACKEDRGRKFVSINATGRVSVNGGAQMTVPLYGAFCTGSYSYIWNSGYFFDGEQYDVGSARMASLSYSMSDGSGGQKDVSSVEGFKLLKVKDSKRSVCIAAVRNLGGGYNDNLVSGELNIVRAEDNDYGLINEVPVDIMAMNNINEDSEGSTVVDGMLALYDLDAAAPVVDGAINNMFYAASFILGTVQGGINITSGNYCVTPDADDPTQSEVEAFDYCAINKFNFAAQSTGGGGKE